MVVVRACWPSLLAMQKACSTLRAAMRSRLSPPCTTMRSTTCSHHDPQSLWRTADDRDLSEPMRRSVCWYKQHPDKHRRIPGGQRWQCPGSWGRMPAAGAAGRHGCPAPPATHTAAPALAQSQISAGAQRAFAHEAPRFSQHSQRYLHGPYNTTRDDKQLGAEDACSVRMTTLPESGLQQRKRRPGAAAHPGSQLSRG